jgi:hypothetical protein
MYAGVPTAAPGRVTTVRAMPSSVPRARAPLPSTTVSARAAAAFGVTAAAVAISAMPSSPAPSEIAAGTASPKSVTQTRPSAARTSTLSGLKSR